MLMLLSSQAFSSFQHPARDSKQSLNPHYHWPAKRACENSVSARLPDDSHGGTLNELNDTPRSWTDSSPYGPYMELPKGHPGTRLKTATGNADRVCHLTDCVNTISRRLPSLGPFCAAPRLRSRTLLTLTISYHQLVESIAERTASHQLVEL